MTFGVCGLLFGVALSGFRIEKLRFVIMTFGVCGLLFDVALSGFRIENLGFLIRDNELLITNHKL